MDAKELYTKRSWLYDTMIGVIGHRRSLTKFFLRGDYLRPAARILDAGCGSGAVTQALLAAAEVKNIHDLELYGFDLTETMLDTFKKWISVKNASIQLQKADVLKLPQELPPSWEAFDLIVSAGMLEYLPKDKLPQALQNLHRLLKATGKIIIFISRDHFFNKIVIKKFWKAEVYKKEELINIFRAAGLEPLEIRRFKIWGFAVVAQAK